MPSGLGSADANGVWQYGESDTESLASDLLNKGQATVSTQIAADRARLTALESKYTWTTFAPTLTAFAATATCSYRREGDVIRVRFKFVLTAAITGGNPEMSLPVNSAPPAHDFAAYQGGGSIFNGSVASSLMVAASAALATRVRFYTGSYAPITGSAPFASAVGHILQGEFTYRAA